MTAQFQNDGLTGLFVAPSGGVVVGVPVVIGNLLVIPAATAAVGVDFVGYISGVFELDCDSADVIVAGDGLDWDTSTGTAQPISFTTATGDLIAFGVAVDASPSGAVVVLAKINVGVALVA